MEFWNTKLLSVFWCSALMEKQYSPKFLEERNIVEFEKLMTHMCKERPCKPLQGKGQSNAGEDGRGGHDRRTKYGKAARRKLTAIRV